MSANPTTRAERKTATRAALLRASRESLEARGWEGTTIASITRAAGVAHGTFYVHFESKEAVADELLDRFNRDLARDLTPVFATVRERALGYVVRQAAEVFLDHWSSRRGFVECYVQRAGMGAGPDRLRDGVNPPMLALLEQALEGEAARLGLTRRGFRLVTHGLLAMWLRLGLQHLFNESVGREEVVDVLVWMTVGSIDGVLDRTGAGA